MACLVYTVARTPPELRRMFGAMFYLRGCYRYGRASLAVFHCAVPIVLTQEGK